MTDVLRGRAITEAYHLGKKFAVKLDDGCELIIEVRVGPGAYYEWGTWTEVSHQKDGKVLSSWRLEDSGKSHISKPKVPNNVTVDESGLSRGSKFTSEF